MARHHQALSAEIADLDAELLSPAQLPFGLQIEIGPARKRGVGVLIDTPAVLRVRVESTQTRVRCPHCGFKCHRVHDTREREVRDLEVSGRHTVLAWTRHRFSCGNCCERFLEGHGEFDGRIAWSATRNRCRSVRWCAATV